MFQIRAAFNEQLDVKASVERAREFFADLRNFAELMPGVERITNDAEGVARWLIRAEVPVIGSMRQAFAVEQSIDAPARIEWTPVPAERKNLLRYSAAFLERGSEWTRVLIEQRVELRRQAARELHLLAGMVGESRLSAELQKGVSNMMRTFLERARAKLERSTPNP
jgi:hypothetical protein